MYCMCKCMYESVYVGLSVKTLFALEFKNPVKSSTVPVHPDKWHTLMSFHFPCLVTDFPPCLSLNFLCAGLSPCLPLCQTCSSCGFLLSVTRYLSLPVSFFSVSGPCLVNLEVSLCPSHPYPPSMDKHIGHVGPSVKGSSHKRPSPSPQIWAVQYTDGWVSHSPSSCWLTWGCG